MLLFSNTVRNYATSIISKTSKKPVKSIWQPSITVSRLLKNRKANMHLLKQQTVPIPTTDGLQSTKTKEEVLVEGEEVPQKLKRKMELVQNSKWLQQQVLKKPIAPNKKLSEAIHIPFTKRIAAAPLESSILSYLDRIHAGRRRGQLHLQALAKKKKDPLLQRVFDKHKVKFVCSADSTHAVPAASTVEFCFFGRSNVGKSSLLNSLCGAGEKAKVSAKPGETQSINFYAHMDEIFTFVDFPGYGFAFADPEKLESWKLLIRNYLLQRKKSGNFMRKAYVLIDSRHGVKPADEEFLSFLNENQIRNQIVMTKNDLVVPETLSKLLYIVQNQISKYKYTDSQVLVCSSLSKSGIIEFQRQILGLLDVDKLNQVKQRIQKREQKQMKAEMEEFISKREKEE